MIIFRKLYAFSIQTILTILTSLLFPNFILLTHVSTSQEITNISLSFWSDALADNSSQMSKIKNKFITSEIKVIIFHINLIRD